MKTKPGGFEMKIIKDTVKIAVQILFGHDFFDEKELTKMGVKL